MAGIRDRASEASRQAASDSARKREVALRDADELERKIRVLWGGGMRSRFCAWAENMGVDKALGFDKVRHNVEVKHNTEEGYTWTYFSGSMYASCLIDGFIFELTFSASTENFESWSSAFYSSAPEFVVTIQGSSVAITSLVVLDDVLKSMGQ